MKDLLLDQQRAAALTGICVYCSQPIGEPCINPRTGYELEHQAAHLVRIHAAASLEGTR